MPDMPAMVLKVDSTAAVTSLQRFADATKAAGGEGTKMGAAYKAAADQFIAATNGISDAYENELKALKDASDAQKDHADSMSAAAEAVKKNVSHLQNITQMQEKYLETLRASGAPLEQIQYTEQALAETRQSLQNETVNLANAQSTATQATEQYQQAFLQLQTATNAMNVEMRDTMSLFNEGRSVMEATITPAEQYAQTQAHLKEMLNAGAISQEAYNRSLAQASSEMANATNASMGLSNRFKDMVSAAGLAAAAYKALNVAVKGVADAQQTMMTNAKLEAVVKATGASAGYTAEQLKEMSKAMSENSIYSQATITNAQAMLLTFTEISGDVFPRAMGAISDMSMLFGSLEGGVTLLGKALENPVDGLAALSKTGFKFSDEFKAVNKTLVESGDIAEAQRRIMSELEAQMQGLSQAVADTAAGKLQILKNQFADIAAEAGTKLIPTMVLMQTIVNEVSKALTEKWYVATGVAAAGLILLSGAIHANAKAILKHLAVLAMHPFFAIAAGIALAIVGIAYAIDKVSASMKAANAPMLETATAVNVVSANLDDVKGKYEKFGNAVAEASMTAAQKAAAGVDEQFGQLAKNVVDSTKKIEQAIVANSESVRKLQEAIAIRQMDGVKQLTQEEMTLLMKGKASKELIEKQSAVNAYNADRARLNNLQKTIEAQTEMVKEGEQIRATVESDFQKLRNRAIADATKSERDERKKLLQQMSDDILDENKRQIVQLERNIAEKREKLKGDAEGQALITKWGLNEVKQLQEKQADEQKKLEKERVDAVRSFLTGEQALRAEHQKKIEEIEERRKTAKLETNDPTVWKAQLKAAEEYYEALDDMHNERANKIAELMGIEQSATQKLGAEYEKRKKAIQAAATGEDAILSQKQMNDAIKILTSNHLRDMEMLELQSQENKINLMRDGADKQIALIQNRAEQEHIQLESMKLTQDEFYNAEVELARRTAEQIALIRQQQFEGLMNTAQGLLGQLSGIESQYFSNKSVALENQYKKEKKYIENSTMGEIAKADALKALDEKTQAEREKLAKKQFDIEKALGITNATINTALAVTKALTAGPIAGPILAGAIGALGAVQIGLIASAPRPMDRGGMLADGEYAYVGERRPEIVTGGSLIRGPANITSGAETAKILAAASGETEADGGGETTTSGNTEMVVNIYDSQMNFAETARQSLRSGAFDDVLGEMSIRMKRMKLV